MEYINIQHNKNSQHFPSQYLCQVTSELAVLQGSSPLEEEGVWAHAPLLQAVGWQHALSWDSVDIDKNDDCTILLTFLLYLSNML